MAIPAQQIGWSQKSKLLWNISKQLERLTGVTASDGSPYTKAINTTITDWTFTPGDIFVFPSNADGYTLYTGGWTNYDDGFTTEEIPFAGIFNSDEPAPSDAFILSTNGYFFGNHSELNIYGNSGDLYLTPGAPLLDGDTQNFWYKNTIISGCKWKTSILVYCGRYEAEQTPYSYIINVYKDSTYQYIETVCKANLGTDSGPDSNKYPASNLTQVWQSDLLGTSWNYLGFGSIDGGTPITTTTTTTTAGPTSDAYSYVISQTDLDAAIGNTDTNLNGKVYTMTIDDGSGNPASRTFTASGSYNHWMCSTSSIIPTFGYYAADVFITGTLVSTQTNIGAC